MRNRVYQLVIIISTTILICLTNSSLFAQSDDDLGQRVGIEVHFPDRDVRRAFIYVVDGVYRSENISNIDDAMVWRAGASEETDDHHRMYPKLIPGKTYTLVAQAIGDMDYGESIYFDLKFDVPVGYSVMMGGEDTKANRIITQFDHYYTDNNTVVGHTHAGSRIYTQYLTGGIGTTKYPIKLVKTGVSSALSAADISQSKIGDKYLMSLGVGLTLNKLEEARIWVNKEFLEATIPVYNVSSIWTTEIYSDTDIKYFTNTVPQQIKQVRTDGGLVTVEYLPSAQEGFRLNYYRGIISTVNNEYVPVESAYASVTFENPTPNVVSRKLLVTRQYGNHINKFLYTYADNGSGNITWTLQEGQLPNGNWLRKTKVDYTVENNKKVEIISIYGRQGEVAEQLQSKKKYIYTTIDWSAAYFNRTNLKDLLGIQAESGNIVPPDFNQWPSTISNGYSADPAVEKIIIDPDEKQYTTELYYYNNFSESNIGQWGKIEGVKNADTSWFKYKYYTASNNASLAELKNRGMVKYIMKPWKDAPSYESAQIDNCDVLYYNNYVSKNYIWTYYPYLEHIIREHNYSNWYPELAETTERIVNNIVIAKSVKSVERPDFYTGYVHYYLDNDNEVGISYETIKNVTYTTSTNYLSSKADSYLHGVGYGFSNKPHIIYDDTDTPIEQYFYDLGFNGNSDSYSINYISNNKSGAFKTQASYYSADGLLTSSENNYYNKNNELVGFSTMNKYYNDYKQLTTVYDDNNGNAEKYIYHDDLLYSEQKGHALGVNSTGDLDNFIIESEIIYTYDEINRITSKNIKGLDSGVGLQSDHITNYEYDASNNVIRKNITGGNISITNSTKYNIAGQIVERTDENQLTTKYRYSTNGQIGFETVIYPGPQPATDTDTFPAGCSYRTTTNYLDGRLKSVTGSSTIDTYYDYKLSQVTGCATEEIVFTGSGGLTSPRKSTKRYDMAGRLVEEELPPVPGQSTGAVRKTKYLYDSHGRLSMKLTPSVTDLNSFVETIYEYDTYGRLFRTGFNLISEATPALDLNSLDRISDNHWEYESINGQCWRVTTDSTYPRQDSGHYADAVITSISKTQISFDPATRVRFKNNTYDINGNLSSETVTLVDAKHLHHEYISPGAESASSVEIYNGLQFSATGSDNITTTIGYDGLGRATSSIDPRTGTTTTEYTPNSNQIKKITYPDGNNITYDYYSNTEIGAGNIKVFYNRNNRITRNAYDTYGRKIAIWGDNNNPIVNVYNEFGEKVTQYTYRNDQIIWKSGGSWVTSLPESLASGSITSWNYDSASGLITSTVIGSGGNANTTSYYYWPNGLLSGTWQTKDTTNNTYYGKALYYNNRTGETTAIQYSDNTPSVYFSYNRMGLTESIWDVTGQRMINYDLTDGTPSLSQLGVSRVGSNPFYQDDLVIKYTSHSYADGREIQQIQNGYESLRGGQSQMEITTGYDWQNGRLGNLTLNPKQADLAAGVQITPTYEPQSSLLSLYTATLRNGGTFQINYEYEPTRGLTTLVENKVYDSQGSSVDVATFSYHNNVSGYRDSIRQTGLISGRYLHDGYTGLVTTCEYNDKGELQHSFTQLGEGHSPPAQNPYIPGRNYSYGYDSSSNRTSLTRDGSTIQYSNDDQNRLIQQDVDGIVRVNGFAAEAAVVQVDDVQLPSTARSADYFYYEKATDNSERPSVGTLSIFGRIPLSGPDEVSKQEREYYVPKTPEIYNYDAAGNLLEDGEWIYDWNSEHQLVSMERKQSAVYAGAIAIKLVYQYDYQGRRVSKTVFDKHNGQYYTHSDTTYFTYNGTRLTMEINQTGAVMRKYFWGQRLLMISDYTGATTVNYYPGMDANGNIVCLIQENDGNNLSSGSVAGLYEYGPYGEVIRQSGSAAEKNPFRYSSEYIDRETGYSAFLFRYYNPVTGRWLNRDPIGEAGGTNLYAFVGNNPVNYNDLLGLCGSQGTGMAMSNIVILPIWGGDGISLDGMSEANLFSRMSQRQKIYMIWGVDPWGWSNAMLNTMDEMEAFHNEVVASRSGDVTKVEITGIPRRRHGKSGASRGTRSYFDNRERFGIPGEIEILGNSEDGFDSSSEQQIFNRNQATIEQGATNFSAMRLKPYQAPMTKSEWDKACQEYKWHSQWYRDELAANTAYSKYISEHYQPATILQATAEVFPFIGPFFSSDNERYTDANVGYLREVVGTSDALNLANSLERMDAFGWAHDNVGSGVMNVWSLTLPMQLFEGGVYTPRAGAAAKGTGTVWDGIKATQPLYEGTALPRSFEMATANGKVWVHGNATEHMAEYATSMLNRGVSPSLVNMGTQSQLTSLQAAVNAATAKGVQYGKLLNVGGWELKFGAPLQPGQLPALFHALPK